MRSFSVAALCLAASFWAPLARAADGRFFLFVADEPPAPELVRASLREARALTPPLAPEASRERIGKAFPRLFAGGRTVDKSALEADLKAGRALHFAGQYQESEAAFTRALELAAAEPELLSDAKLLQRLVDGAATRYKNTLARKRPKAEARTQIEEFLDHYPLTTPTASDHAPEVIKLWNEVRAAAKERLGSLVVNVHPLELERGGSCKLSLNGAEVADLPQPGALAVPRGVHLVQVRCGPQVGWLQRVEVGAGPVALRVPVRAMLSARGDAASGGVVLVAPAEGDAAALVEAVSVASDTQGAVVAIAAKGKVRLGRWDRAVASPVLASIGAIEANDVVKVRPIGSKIDDESSGRVWTWVVGGIGLATLAGAVVANVITADEINSGNPDTEGLKTATIALYIAGGALVATGIVLFFVEGDDDDGSAAFAPGPGGLVVRF